MCEHCGGGDGGGGARASALTRAEQISQLHAYEKGEAIVAMCVCVCVCANVCALFLVEFP